MSLHPDTGQPTWPGPYVTCGVCAVACVPTWAGGDRWQMPNHPIPLTTGDARAHFGQMCPGSGAAVTRPVHKTMERRIEDHVVAAMPPEHQDIPDAKGLTEADPMKGPS